MISRNRKRPTEKRTNPKQLFLPRFEPEKNAELPKPPILPPQEAKRRTSEAAGRAYRIIKERIAALDRFDPKRKDLEQHRQVIGKFIGKLRDPNAIFLDLQGIERQLQEIMAKLK